MSASTQPRSTTREKDVAAACSGRASRGRACRIKPKMRRPCAGRRLALSSSPASRRRRRRDVQVAPSPFVVDRADVASVDDRARAEAVATRVVSNEQKDAPADALREEPNRRTRRSGAERACARAAAERRRNETTSRRSSASALQLFGEPSAPLSRSSRRAVAVWSRPRRRRECRRTAHAPKPWRPVS